MKLHRYATEHVAPGSAGDLFRLIRSEGATSRTSLARLTGLAPSTVSLRVADLERTGLVTTNGDESSRGGRPARRLQLAASAGVVGAVDLGAGHIQVAVADLGGTILLSHAASSRVGNEPRRVVDELWGLILGLVDTAGLSVDLLRGIVVGLPAPVEYSSGRVIMPSFMPSWHGADIPELFAKHTDVPVFAENDANLFALAEGQADTSSEDHSLAVKLGTRIGCGVISGGRLHRGFGGAAGEIAHSPVLGEGMLVCACGNVNCLESVASGGALTARLARLGYEVTSTADVVRLGASMDPVALDVLREAGAQIASVLMTIVNFFNPREVVLGGTMSSSMTLVAAIRAELFQRCLPLATDQLEVRAAASPHDAGIRGAIRLGLDEILAPARVQELVHSSESARDVTAAGFGS